MEFVAICYGFCIKTGFRRPGGRNSGAAPLNPKNLLHRKVRKERKEKYREIQNKRNQTCCATNAISFLIFFSRYYNPATFCFPDKIFSCHKTARPVNSTGEINQSVFIGVYRWLILVIFVVLDVFVTSSLRRLFCRVGSPSRPWRASR